MIGWRRLGSSVPEARPDGMLGSHASLPQPSYPRSFCAKAAPSSLSRDQASASWGPTARRIQRRNNQQA